MAGAASVTGASGCRQRASRAAAAAPARRRRRPPPPGAAASDDDLQAQFQLAAARAAALEDYRLLMQEPDASLDQPGCLLRGATLLARHRYPRLQHEEVVERLDDLAVQVGAYGEAESMLKQCRGVRK